MNEEKRGAGERTAAVSIGTNSCYSNRNRFEHGIFDKIHGTVLRCRSNYARAYSTRSFPKKSLLLFLYPRCFECPLDRTGNFNEHLYVTRLLYFLLVSLATTFQPAEELEATRRVYAARN